MPAHRPPDRRRVTSSATSATTLLQSPGAGCRNSRAVGYQGESDRSTSLTRQPCTLPRGPTPGRQLALTTPVLVCAQWTSARCLRGLCHCRRG